MARHEYRGLDPVEEILRIAMRNHGGADMTLRQRLLTSGAELGLSEEEILKAEQEWLEQKRQSDDIDEYREDALRAFWTHFGVYFVVNAMLALMNLMQRGNIGWAIWPILGWGVGLGCHLVATVIQIQNPGGEDFVRWQSRVDRHRNRRQDSVTGGIGLGTPRNVGDVTGLHSTMSKEEILRAAGELGISPDSVEARNRPQA